MTLTEMTSAVIGNVFTLKHTCTNNASGALTDAASVLFEVEPPVGAKVTGAPTRHTGVGLYEYDFKPTLPGTHLARVETTNPDSARKSSFYVEPDPLA